MRANTTNTHLGIGLLLVIAVTACGEKKATGGKDGSAQNCSAINQPFNQPQPAPPSGFGIIGGERANGNPEVVMLTLDYGDRLGVCSATFIGHNVLATAGHCVTDTPLQGIKAHIGTEFVPLQAAGSATGIRALQKFSSLPPNQPEANRELVALDFALLLTPPNSAPAIANLSITSVQLNSLLEIVGFGNVDDSGTGSGVKRRAQTTVIDNGFDSTSLVAGAIFTGELTVPGATLLGRVAQGDSGGPLFDRSGNLVGVTSIGIEIVDPSGGLNASGFNSIKSQAAQQILQQARAAGAAIGVPSQQNGGPNIRPNDPNVNQNGANGTPQACT